MRSTLLFSVLVCEMAHASLPRCRGGSSGPLARKAAPMRLRGGGIPVEDLLRLGEGEHTNATVAEANMMLWESCERGHLDGMNIQIQAGAEVNARGPGGWTALHYAARYGHHDVICRLLDLGANIDPRTRVHFTPLHHAAMRGHTAAAMRLVSAGADIHAQTLDDLTPLDWAARNGHVPCLVALHDAAKHLESIPKQPPGSVTTFSRSGEVVEVRVTRPDTTGRELLTPWARFGKFEWLQKGPSHM